MELDKLAAFLIWFCGSQAKVESYTVNPGDKITVVCKYETGYHGVSIRGTDDTLTVHPSSSGIFSTIDNQPLIFGTGK